MNPKSLEDAEHTTHDLLNELANESDEVARQVELRPVGAEAGNLGKQSASLIVGHNKSH